ncbi:hypothetical protein [Streptomyces sp. 1222.5]|uniref:hypothetical protein n=1 Tax=Streptomyces sp. 1222.5 TaxID=1881026 RepID=UPI003D722881
MLHGSQQRDLAEARANAQSLGGDVVRRTGYAKGHHHWGHRQWNAWKSARRRAQQ